METSNGEFFAIKTETRRRKQMVVRCGHFEKQDVVDALEILRNVISYAEVAQTSSIPSRTLFKKAKDNQNGIPIEGLHRGTKSAISADLEIQLME